MRGHVPDENKKLPLEGKPAAKPLMRRNDLF
jgi:hypothetical protein